MRFRKVLAQFISVFTSHVVGSALAQEAVSFNNIELSAEHGVTNYRASESLAGKVIAEDRGALTNHGFRLSARDAVVTEIAYHRQYGLVPYKGFNQFGFPLLSKTDIDLSSLRFFLDKALQVSTNVPLSLGLGIQRTQWDRVIFNRGSSPSLIEKLTASSIHFRVSAKQSSTLFGMASALESSFNVGHDVHTKLDVQSSSGIPDRIALRPRLGPSYELSLSAVIFPLPWLGLEYKWVGAQRQFGSSSSAIGTINGQPYGTVSYPGARQFQNSQIFGIRALF